MIYKCSKCGEEYENMLQCEKCEEKHRKKDSPIIFKDPKVYEGYFDKEYGDYGPSFRHLDGSYMLGEGDARHLITYSNINPLHDFEDYKGRPMRITISAEFLDESPKETDINLYLDQMEQFASRRKGKDALDKYYNSEESKHRS